MFENHLYVLRREGPAGPERYVFVGRLDQLAERVKWSSSPHYDFVRGEYTTEIMLPTTHTATTPLLRLTRQHYAESLVNRLPPRKSQPVSIFDTGGTLLESFPSIRQLRAAIGLRNYLAVPTALAWAGKTHNDRVILWT